MENERARKWRLYHMAEAFVNPKPEWGEETNLFTVEGFVEYFGIPEEEAGCLIDKLVETKKLAETEEKGTYKAIRVCSICGKRFDNLDIQEDHRIKHYFGYGSRYDLQIFEADLCLSCFDKIIDMVLPLFPSSPLREYDNYADPMDGKPSILEAWERDNDPY